METPLVSVIVSAYRQPAFLNAALAGVATQSYKHIEILVVDDGSGEEFTRQYGLPANARLIVHPLNRGVAAVTRNTGIAAARGKYVAFLDQDDFWLPEKIAVQVEALEEYPEALLHFTHVQKVDAELRPLKKQDDPIVMRDAVREMVYRNFIECPSQVMMTRAGLEKLGTFDENIRGASDWDMWLRAAAQGALLSDARALVLYRTHGQQWSKSGVMVATAGARVLEKARGWLAAMHPRLRLLLKLRHARLLREVARVQLERHVHEEEALGNLCRAVKTWPLSFKAWMLMPRALVNAKSKGNA